MFTLLIAFVVMLFRLLPRTNCKTEQQPNLSYRSFSISLHYNGFSSLAAIDQTDWVGRIQIRIQASSNGHRVQQ